MILNNKINLYLSHQISISALFLMINVGAILQVAESISHPLIGPDAINFGNLQSVAIIYQPLAKVQPQNGLPAPEGTAFDGPDPGLNANIIGGGDCPHNHRKDGGGICRLEFAYGPHPFSAITSQTFKGSLYMGFQVGNAKNALETRRRFRLRFGGLGGPMGGRFRERINIRNFRPINKNSDDDDD